MLDTFNKQKLYDNFTAALSKARENIKMIDLLLGLAGATALVFVALLNSSWVSFCRNRYNRFLIPASVLVYS